jgi:sirohydrochlorin ferrochelatase
VAATIRRMRRDVDVRVAFCEQNFPNLRDVLTATGSNAVVVPLLLADAYHARVDIPALIEESGTDAVRADVLGEDDRLVAVLRQRLTHAGVSQLDPGVGILVTAVGSSRPQANTRTALVAEYLAQQTRWRATTAFATGPQPTLAQAADLLRERGATRLVVAPWFLAYGRLTDRIAEFACAQGIPMAAPLGPHRLVADTVLDRFDQALAERAAA